MNKTALNFFYGSMWFKKWQRKAYSVFNSMHRVVNIGKVSFSYILVMIAIPGYAQPDTLIFTKDIDIDEIIVTAKRSPVVYSRLSRIVNTVSDEELQHMPVHSLQDALSYVPGLDIKQRGPEGVQADISIRGGSFDQNLVLFNGINMNDPQTGHFALNIPVDLSAVKEIEILQGSGSRIFGPGAYSGVVNFITQPADSSKAEISLLGGHHDLYKTVFTAHFTTDQFRTMISASRSGSGGYVENTDFDISKVFLHSQYQLPNNTVDFQLGFSDRGFGAQGFYTPQYPHQFESNTSYYSSLSLHSKMDNIHFHPSVYWRRHKDRFELFREASDWYQRENSYFVKGSNDTAKFTPGIYEPWNYYAGHNYHLTDVYGSRMNVTFQSLLGETSLGFDFRSENIWSNVLGNPMDDTLKVRNDPHGFYTKRYTRTLFNSYFEHTIYVGNFVVSGGFLAGWSNEFDRNWNIFPGVDVSYRFSRSLKIFGSLNRSLRLPTFTDLFYSGPSNVGNPDLLPEKNIAAELGLKLDWKNSNAYLTYFYSDADDVIAWVNLDTQNGKQFKTANLTEVKKQGVEMQFKQQFPGTPFFNQVDFHYTYVDQTKDAGDFTSKYALNYLKHKFVSRLHLTPLENTRITIAGIFRDRNGSFPVFDSSENQYLPDRSYQPYWLLNSSLNYYWKNWDFSIEITNLADRDYFDMGHIEMPGRWIKIGVNKKFD